ncbi:MAG TPA: MOSC domain-containing protein [Chlamydiales bacterium]|nr:MOSC domain-containing protein [Chlamydiales bacterium]
MDEKEKIKTVSALFIYPVKSLKGLSVQKFEIGAKGPMMDRRWMVVDKEGRFLSQRVEPKMALITVELFPDKILLKAPRVPPVIVTRANKSEVRSVVIWKDTVDAIDQGNQAAEWLTEFLGFDARLVFLPDETVRKVNPKYATADTDQVSFADAYPLLVISEASLADLNWRLKTPIQMNRFRPNLVISGCEPYEEDTWKRFRIGDMLFECVKPCSRCVTVTIDQHTAEKDPEPLEVLATYRKEEGGIMFGQNVIPKNQGIVSIGAEVKVLETR